MRKKVLVKSKLVSLLILLFLCIIFTASYNNYAANVFTYHHLTMNTAVDLRFEAKKVSSANNLKDQVVAEMERLENIFSRGIASSEVSAVNRNAGIQPVEVSAELLYLVERAIEYAIITEGAFDPTVAPLIDLWGFMDFDNESTAHQVPDAVVLKNTLSLVDYRMVEVDIKKSTIYLPVQGMALELGGIAKGYIVDRALDVIKESGAESAYVNAGGDIALLGSRADGNPWRIAIDHPRKESAGHYLAILNITDSAILTSGDYVRYYELAGIRYHHLLNPKTGMPARSLISVTVIAETAVAADALSTAIFILGPDKGLPLVESLEGVEVVMVKPNLEIIYSSGLAGLLEMQ